MKDIGAVSIKTDGNIFSGDVSSPDGSYNTGDYNVLNLKPFSINFNLGTNSDARPGIAGQTTRVNKGSKKAVPFTMEAVYSRRPLDLGADQIMARDIDTITYLSLWARNRTVVMMFWMPNDNDSSLLNNGQEPDFYTSQLRTLYDVLWDKSTGSSTSGYQSSSYGTYHYSISMGSSIGTYLPCAIPIVIDNVQVKEIANSFAVRVSVTGYVLEDEEQESRV